ncbi:hypothetical protein L0U88_01445 [Flavihumibacter sp. RY-1]|uniref:DUF4345 domain-containing protein n=1 Tax=Flavihumibacter fluminis TaxID=2909236 RepID=A0ABS9BEQ1_9BACT|nr:hypothetical protein [Flavihumibacter fluminis]MCF1713289.1 hypothetical protein [Flavihumibacter fluminis]
MRAKDFSFYSWIFLLAALWNLIGTCFGYFNTAFTFEGVFDKPLTDPLFFEIYRGAWGTTFLFFIGYLLVAYNPIKHWGIALVGGIGKLAFAISELQLFHANLANQKILIIVIGDFLFCIVFIGYFLKLIKYKEQV